MTNTIKCWTHEIREASCPKCQSETSTDTIPTDNAGLLACPFCGGEASIGTVRYSRPLDDVRWAVDDTLVSEAFYGHCTRCSCGHSNSPAGGHRTEAEAIHAWNTRLAAEARQPEPSGGEKIIAGLEDALAYQQGDHARGKAHHVRVTPQPEPSGDAVEGVARAQFVADLDALVQTAEASRHHTEGSRNSVRVMRDCAIRSFDAALAAMPSITAAEGWQPIETAPRDGTPLVLFARAQHATASVVVVGWFLRGENRWVEAAFSPNVPVGVVPSHWMPRPAFPSATAIRALEPSDHQSGQEG